MPAQKHTRADLDEQAADELATTVKLATHAFDGLDLQDAELDDLCEIVLTNNNIKKSAKQKK